MNLQLRPLSISELLDRTVTLYRQHFSLFVGISLVLPVLALAANLALDFLFRDLLLSSDVRGLGLFTVVKGLVTFVIYFFGSAITQAAGVKAVSSVYLGQATTIAQSYHKLPIGRVLLITFLIVLFMGGFGLLFGVGIGALIAVLSMVVGKGITGVILMVIGITVVVAAGAILLFRLFARYALAVPVCVIEGKGIFDSIRRSAFLAKGELSKIVSLIVVIAILGIVIGLIFLVPVQIASVMLKKFLGMIGIQILSNLADFCSSALVAPVGAIWLALLYYDMRIRKEAFDIELMMRELGVSAPEPLAYGANLEGPTPPPPGFSGSGL